MATVNQAIVSIGAFLQPHMPTGCQIIRGQANQSPPPKSPFVVLTPIGMPQYTTTRARYNGTEMVYDMPTKLNIQMDFYGMSGGESAKKAVTLLRSMATDGKFPAGIFPLFCTDGVQFPLTNAEKQYEDRWSTTLTLQYNAPVAINTPSFNTVGEVIADPTNVTTPLE